MSYDRERERERRRGEREGEARGKKRRWEGKLRRKREVIKAKAELIYYNPSGGR